MKDISNGIKVYAINLKRRIDRRNHIINEFSGKEEIDFQIIQAIEEKNGTVGLWRTMKKIIQYAIQQNNNYVVICEDDHQFTSNYDIGKLFDMIQMAEKFEADILLGGVSWFTKALQISTDLFWVEKFSGLQFTVVYKKFFNVILDSNFSEEDTSDFKISSLTENKLLIFPFISTQKEFGYSDVTLRNNKDGFITQIFNDASQKLQQLKTVRQFYGLEFDINEKNKS